MQSTDTGTGSAKIKFQQRWRSESEVRRLLRDALKEVRADNPKADNRELLEKFIVRCREDDKYIIAALEYSFINAEEALHKEEQEHLTAQELADEAIERARRAQAHAKRVKHISGKLVSLTYKAPNGKLLGECTKAECQHFGGWYGRVAEVLGPKQKVRDVFNNKQLRSLYRTA